MTGLKRPIELVLFDLGGTLFHELGPWGELHRRADAELWKVLHEAGVILEPADIYGDARNLFALYYQRHRNDLNEPTSAAVLDALLRAKGIGLDKDTLRAGMRAMFAVTQTNWRAEDDAMPVLQALQSAGFKIGAVSNGSDDDNTQSLVDESGLRPYLEFIISSAAFGKRKPDASIFRAALQHFGTAPERTVMVGDSYEADVEGAHGVGMQAIWITRRVEPPFPPHAEADAMVKALSEIPPLLRGP